jgi:hypothetical protein
VLLGEEIAEADLVRPLVSFLTETLAGMGTLALAA